MLHDSTDIVQVSLFHNYGCEAPLKDKDLFIKDDCILIKV